MSAQAIREEARENVFLSARGISNNAPGYRRNPRTTINDSHEDPKRDGRVRPV